MESPVSVIEVPVKPVPVGPKLVHSISIEVWSNDNVKVESKTYGTTEGGTEVSHDMTFGKEKSILRDVMDSRQDQLVSILCANFIDNALKQKIQPNGFRQTSVGKFLLGK